MTRLREDVRIITPGGELTGHLYVGEDGLPELLLETDIICACPYRPATFPAAWSLTMLPCVRFQGPLFHAWRYVNDARKEIIKAQREAEAEQETPEPEDDLTAFKRHRALEEEERQ